MIDDGAIMKQDIQIIAEQMQGKREEQNVILPKGFVYLNDISPSIIVELKYATDDNFTGEVVPGYHSNNAICTAQAAQALHAAQEELNSLGLTLKVFDFYRPHSSAQHFKKWCLNGIDDAVTKARFYPKVEKADLCNGYVAEFSKHSRGSTVDLTIVKLESGKELEMGTEFDFFGEESNTYSALVSDAAKVNRQLLLDVMNKHGFDNYRMEWWHFELRDEPFPRKPEDHFDFDVH